jgi:hypothetical protein
VCSLARTTLAAWGTKAPETDCLGDLLAPYNAMNGKSLYFRKNFARKTGIAPKKTSPTRWYGDIDQGEWAVVFWR